MMESTGAQILILEDSDALARAAAERTIGLARRTLERANAFRLALAGGNTPRKLYSLLATLPYRDELDWSRIHLYWGDERCVPPEHPESNFGMARSELLSKITIPDENVLRIKGELEPHKAASEYEERIRVSFPDARHEIPRFDLILLGMGADGHTASLFPATEALNETRKLVTANYIPKLETRRITMTFPLINAARSIFLLIAGGDKASVVAEVLNAERRDAYPVERVRPSSGDLLWFLDREAARDLPRMKVRA